MENKRKWKIASGIIVTAALVAAVTVVVYFFPKKEEGQYVDRGQAYQFEDESVYAVYAPEDGEYELLIEGNGNQSEALSLMVNGIAYEEEIKQGIVQVALYKGINSISLMDSGMQEGAGITVKGCPAYPAEGAFVNYVTYEAEEGETNAQISEGNGRS